jgi:tRNA(His) 5'-end guanylyltransferase
MAIDPINSRMKENYESRFKRSIHRRTYAILRVDGHSFSKYTSKLKKPFDQDFNDDMDTVAKYLCEKIQGARFAYVQSDEISVLITDFDQLTTHAWFDNNADKMISLAAAYSTSRFLLSRIKRQDERLLEFDARIFAISDPFEVANYFLARQRDATKNAINMMGQAYYSTNELRGVNTNQVQELLFQKGVNFNDLPARFKRGGVAERIKYEKSPGVIRTKMEMVETPVFSDKSFLYSRIPVFFDGVENLQELVELIIKNEK